MHYIYIPIFAKDIEIKFIVHSFGEQEELEEEHGRMAIKKPGVTIDNV